MQCGHLYLPMKQLFVIQSLKKGTCTWYIISRFGLHKFTAFVTFKYPSFRPFLLNNPGSFLHQGEIDAWLWSSGSVLTVFVLWKMFNVH